MKLVVDVGNSTTMLARAEAGEIKRVWERRTRAEESAQEYWTYLSELLDSPADFEELIVASVVPSVTETLSEMVKEQPGVNLWRLNFPWEPATVRVNTETPENVGADRVAAAEALYQLYGAGFVVDFGTATTVDAVDSKGSYLGGVIFPGLESAVNGLTERAANLSDFSPEKPEEFKCRETLGALQTGIFHGTVGAVEKMLEGLRSKFSLSPDLPVVATGGWADDCLGLTEEITAYEPRLVLKGLLFCRAE